MQPQRGRTFCQICGIDDDKKKLRQEDEDANEAERLQAADANLLNVTQQMPDRGYDKDRGTPGWLMGEPSPGRSF